MAWRKRLCLRFAALYFKEEVWAPTYNWFFGPTLWQNGNLKSTYGSLWWKLGVWATNSFLCFFARFAAEVINSKGFKELNNLPQVSGWTFRKKKNALRQAWPLLKIIVLPKKNIPLCKFNSLLIRVLLLLLMNRYQVVQWIQVCFCNMFHHHSYLAKKIHGLLQKLP